jgi:CelD/BcsL family acetyltransferase involved in cellulose biosynthesis
VAFYESDDLVGIAPLYLADRIFRFVGVGTTDYLDVLATAEHSPSVIAAFRSYLRDCFKQYDVCYLDCVPVTSPLLSIADTKNIVDSAPVLFLDSANATFLRNLSSNLRKSLRRSAEQLYDKGDASFDEATSETAGPMLDALFRLHAARWAARQQPGVLSDPRVQEFHRAVSHRLLARNCLRLTGIHQNEAWVALLYGMRRGDDVFYYLSGFDPAYERMSPGSLLIQHGIEQAIAERMKRIHFLRGREAYKYHWGATDRPLWMITIAAGTKL